MITPVDRGSAHAPRAPRPAGVSVSWLDPDARMVRGLWLVWALAAPIGIALLVFGPRGFFPLFTPLWALLILWPLWHSARALWHVIADAPHQDWNGSYYAFDGRQIRVQVDAEHSLWFSAVDVLDALRIEGRNREPARLRLDAGRDGLRLLPGDRQLWFSEPGLLAWLSRRRAARCIAFGRWLEAEVVGPQRKRRQKLGTEEPRPGRATRGNSE